MQHGTIRYCPQCSAPDIDFDGKNRFACDRCGFVWYQNTATGCGAILELASPTGTHVLLLERGKEPAKGALDYPGGFVDPGESAEEALHREIREETGLSAHDLRYLTSAPNRYEYRGVTYATCDIVFIGSIDRAPTQIDEGEIAGFHLLAPESIRPERIAFPSLRGAMELYLRRYHGIG